MQRLESKLTHLFRSIATALFAVLTIQIPTTAHVEYSQNASLRLESNKPIQASISRGEPHSYTIQSPGDVFLELLVIQRGIDVVVSLFGPDGGRLPTQRALRLPAFGRGNTAMTGHCVDHEHLLQTRDADPARPDERVPSAESGAVDEFLGVAIEMRMARLPQ